MGLALLVCVYIVCCLIFLFPSTVCVRVPLRGLQWDYCSVGVQGCCSLLCDAIAQQWVGLRRVRWKMRKYLRKGGLFEAPNIVGLIF